MRRRAADRRVASGRQWQADQTRQQGHALPGIEPARGERTLEEDEALLRRFAALPGEPLLDHLDHAEERSVRVVGGGGALDPGLGMPGNVVPEHLHEARLPDARITADENDLALALLRALPPAQEQRTFRLASDERRQRVHAGSLQTTSGAGRLQHPVEADRLRDAAQLMAPALLHDEEPGDEAVRRLRDEEFVRPGELLYARRQVDRFAE